jgi:hypothetical protein
MEEGINTNADIASLLSSYIYCLVKESMVLPVQSEVLVSLPFKIKCNHLIIDSFLESINSQEFKEIRHYLFPKG